MNAPHNTRVVQQDKRRILIIDDNPSIHDDIRKILNSENARNRELEEAKAAVFGDVHPATPRIEFIIDSAYQGEEGLKMVLAAAAAGQPYELAFVDIRMPPGWDGVETVTRLRQASPDLQVVICTAYSDYPWGEMIRKITTSSSEPPDSGPSLPPSGSDAGADRGTVLHEAAPSAHSGNYVANLMILKKPFDNIEVLQLAHALTEKWRLNQQVRTQLDDLDRLIRLRTAELENANALLRREMEEQLRLEHQLRQAQKMEAVGQLAAGIAHDFNNILTVIMGHASLLSEFSDTTPGGAIRQRVKEILFSAERAAILVRQLLAFSRKQLMQFVPLDLGEVILNLGEVLRRVLSERVVLRVEPAGSLALVNADRCTMEQAIINLAVNARDAMPDGGVLSLAASNVEIRDELALKSAEARPGRFVCISVADTGIGIAPEILPRVFEPFFTTKPIGQGTGLGLATVYGIVKQPDGWITIESTVGKGTTFRIFVPVTSKTRGPQIPASIATPITGGHETILVVEDEEAVRQLVVGVLKRNGYRVLEAASGVDALSVYEQCTGRIDLLLTDMVMPGGITGRELAMRLRAHDPSLRIVFMTGYSSSIADAESGNIGLFLKPFSAPDLLRVVRHGLDK